MNDLSQFQTFSLANSLANAAAFKRLASVINGGDEPPFSDFGKYQSLRYMLQPQTPQANQFAPTSMFDTMGQAMRLKSLRNTLQGVPQTGLGELLGIWGG